MIRMTALFLGVLLWAVSISQAFGAVDLFVSIPPQKWLAEKIGQELVNCHVLVGEGSDPHTFEPTPKQMKDLAHAALWFTVDMEFEDRIARKISDAAPGLKIVDTAKGIKKRAMKGQREDAQHDHHDHSHAAEGLDPHVWLSPSHLQTLGLEMARTLGQIDPGNRSRYEQNSLALRNELSALDRSIRALLEPFSGATFYVFHPSFGYFADHYGLVQEPIEVEGKAPSPRQLSKLIKEARKDGVKIIFVQPQFDPKSAASVADAIEGSVVPLDALSENVDENLKTIATRIENALSAGSEEGL